ncbi:hypothetical protein HDU79_010883 [Rhizoclosmatium sp. JEL0117]|nr:hypothetical protein HDU79_010883 [Rhizoclosmatium sp. JEL0117]
MQSLLTLVALSSTALAALNPSTVIKDVVAFGDSLSDNGNFFKLLGAPPAPYWKGRFSNGPVWVEQLAITLNNANLHDYAFGGAVANSSDAYHQPLAKNFTASDLPDLSAQIALWKADSSANTVNLDTTLFTVWAGFNDLSDTVNSGNVPNPVAFATYVLNNVQILLRLGAKNILVNGFPPLDRVPRYNKLPSAALAPIKQIDDGFNFVLSAGISKIQALVPNANIILNDVTPLLLHIDTPEGSEYYGFKNIQDSCFNATSASVCATPDEYFFWDQVHPTTKAHKFIAAGAYNALFNISGFPTVTSASTSVVTASASAVATSSVAVAATYGVPATQALYQSGAKEIGMGLLMAAVGILML